VRGVVVADLDVPALKGSDAIGGLSSVSTCRSKPVQQLVQAATDRFTASTCSAQRRRHLPRRGRGSNERHWDVN
jgi:hypothetical protein